MFYSDLEVGVELRDQAIRMTLQDCSGLGFCGYWRHGLQWKGGPVALVNFVLVVLHPQPKDASCCTAMGNKRL